MSRFPPPNIALTNVYVYHKRDGVETVGLYKIYDIVWDETQVVEMVRSLHEKHTRPLTYYYPAMGPTLPPLVYWGYPTPPVSPAHYYHPPHHPQTMIPEVVSVGGGSPLPIPPPAACHEWPIFMVN
ncbi:unnamed protein product, partial [Iphiclides podalirius]